MCTCTNIGTRRKRDERAEESGGGRQAGRQAGRQGAWREEGERQGSREKQQQQQQGEKRTAEENGASAEAVGSKLCDLICLAASNLEMRCILR